ncbi:MAG TPA: M20/M25/M40 family metallo-hydrolase [Pyrinomonadaceae bacterium]|jgi:hypothetical protein|nr:M20/M25/M40 family metallo-hydrolase [Pyrinomonadaceae bacterium]
MIEPLKVKLVGFLLLLFLFMAGGAGAQPRSRPKISTLEQFQTEFASVPCRNEERLDGVRALFERMGAPASDISIDTFEGVRNLVVIKRGTSAEKIVIGAHYDKVRSGCGAVDNWSGIVTLGHLYRSLKDVALKKTLVFVAFGEEEKGLVGSRAMVKAIKPEELEQYCAMVNIDSLGMGAPQVADNMSSEKLGKLAGELALEMKMPFGHVIVDGANADSSSFKGKMIPALTIFGLGNDWPKVLHSDNDQPSRVNPTSVYLGYRLALYLVVRVEEAACSAYR